MPAYKDQNTGKWYCKFRYKDWKGVSQYKTKRGFDTKREASQWEANFKTRQSGELEMKFKDFVEIYREELFPRLRESTTAAKDNIINTKILPYFGNMKINGITAKDVVAWQNELLRSKNPDTGKPYSQKYLISIHSQLTAIFNYAVKFYELKNNPAAAAGNFKSGEKKKMNIWTPEEYKKFSEEMMDEPMFYYAFEVLYWLGLRKGEMLALTKEDFDFERKTVSVNKTYQVIKGNEIIGSPKTSRSNRIVRMPDFLCEEIQDYLEMLPATHEGRIFPISKTSLFKHMSSGSEKAGVKRIRIHDLRHSHVSLLINMGFSAVAIAERMGHESIHVTYEYAHLFPNAQETMTTKLDELKKEDGENE